MYNSTHYPQPDIYAILSTDDLVDVEGSEHIDADALVMNMFNTPYTPTAQPEFRFPSTSPAIQRVMMEDHPLSPQASQFSSPSLQLNQSNTSIHTQPYTLSNSFTSFQFPEPPTLGRRHSVAVSGGLTDLCRPAPLGFQPQVRTPLVKQQPPSYTPRKTQLSAVMESHPYMGHRASMPNIFLPEHSQRPRVESSSARTTPTNTPPPVSIQFNAMPWSTEPPEPVGVSSQLQQQQPLQQSQHHQQQQHQQLQPQPQQQQHHQQQQPQRPQPHQQQQQQSQQEPFIRKRFYSQQFDSISPIPFYNASTTSQQSSNLCPFPMSGISSRRASVATPQDISTWNRMVDANNRIVPPPPPPPPPAATLPSKTEAQPTIGKKRARVEEETAPRKESRIKLDMVEESLSSEDYPVITDADLDAAKRDSNAIPRRQKLRFNGDQYTPKWVRYTGQSKEGYCDTCQPGKWLQLKNSAFWYHKQFFHGISSVSGKPFEQPLEQQQSGENDVIEGLCHQCHQYVPICNSKRKNSVLWYRHAHKCHIYDKPKSKTLNKRASISPPSNLKFESNSDQLQKIY